ncbi:MAG: hypothetical protein ABS46_02300 [Cytophagaceae bacterium SCN 52-12]|nr:MAG: hypothetical protein ABS46_02300 [Cytophagaceae bacterium SCN 52-12]
MALSYKVGNKTRQMLCVIQLFIYRIYVNRHQLLRQKALYFAASYLVNGFTDHLHIWTEKIFT